MQRGETFSWALVICAVSSTLTACDGDAAELCGGGTIAPSVSIRNRDAVHADFFMPTGEFHGLARVRDLDPHEGALTLEYDNGLAAQVTFALRDGVPLPVTEGQHVRADAYYEIGWVWHHTLELRELDGTLLAAIWSMAGHPTFDWGTRSLSYEDGTCPPRAEECGTVVDRVVRFESAKAGQVVVAPGFEELLGGYRIVNGRGSGRYVPETVRCTDLPQEATNGYVLAAHPTLPAIETDAGTRDEDGGERGDSAADTLRGRCPRDLPGPPLIEIPAPAGASVDAYCMDATEVTNADYAQFLRSRPLLDAQRDVCRANFSYAPGLVHDCVNLFDVESRADHPVTCVDWCDARAYCTWAGKRLCGRIGGGANDYRDAASADHSEWMNACSRGGLNRYPYGEDFDPSKCGNPATKSCGVDRVAVRDACEGGFAGLHDLSGNVTEWEDSCGSEDLDADCLTRGGAGGCDSAEHLACDGGEPFPRDATIPFVGIRCCASL